LGDISNSLESAVVLGYLFVLALWSNQRNRS